MLSPRPNRRATQQAQTDLLRPEWLRRPGQQQKVPMLLSLSLLRLLGIPQRARAYRWEHPRVARAVLDRRSNSVLRDMVASASRQPRLIFRSAKICLEFRRLRLGHETEKYRCVKSARAHFGSRIGDRG